MSTAIRVALENERESERKRFGDAIDAALRVERERMHLTILDALQTEREHVQMRIGCAVKHERTAISNLLKDKVTIMHWAHQQLHSPCPANAQQHHGEKCDDRPSLPCLKSSNGLLEPVDKAKAILKTISNKVF